MRWGDFRRSDNVEDRTEGDSGGGFPLGGGVKLGGGAIIVIVIASLFFGVDPLQMLGTIEGVGSGAPAPAPRPQTAPAPGYGPQYPTRPSEARANDPGTEFVAHVLGDTEDVWGAVFQTMGSRYQPPKLVLFRGGVQSACGRASAAVGPFYCPGDGRLYLDTAFFDELSRRFGAPGDFAQAYVIAHEIGHHVQKLQGIEQQVHQMMESDSGSRNELSVRLELQADCYAGIWGHSTQQRGIIDNADVEQGLNAAAAIGDDRLQRMAGRTVNPERFTHGSSKQRVDWFRRGLRSGRVEDCDTFR